MSGPTQRIVIIFTIFWWYVFLYFVKKDVLRKRIFAMVPQQSVLFQSPDAVLIQP